MFALMLFTFSACSEDTTDGPRQFEVIEADLIQEFSGEAETRFVPVNFDGTFTYKMSDSDWCTAKRTGNGNVVTGINITVTEMFMVTQRIVARTYEPLALYLEVGFIYLMFSTILTWVQRAGEKRLATYGGKRR